MRLVIKVPDKNHSGWLKRLRRVSTFQVQHAELMKELDPVKMLSYIDSLVEFILDYVESPEREEAKLLLEDASESEFQDILSSIMEQSTVPLVSSDHTVDG